MSGTNHPPSTTHLSRLGRRTRVAAAALAVSVGVGAAAATIEWPGAASAAEPAGVSARDARSEAARRAILAELEVLARAVAQPTTTTTSPPPPPPPPTTTTTTAPPPPPPPPPVVAPVTSGSGYNDPANPAAWDRLAVCESSGNWAANTGNGYYGGLQFSMASWQAVGGTGRPDQASRDTQIAMGQRLWNQGGWGHWPGCSSKLGYR